MYDDKSLGLYYVIKGQLNIKFETRKKFQKPVKKVKKNNWFGESILFDLYPKQLYAETSK